MRHAIVLLRLSGELGMNERSFRVQFRRTTRMETG
jgi:hypothetical protein